eukprot:TRINITY_DN4736_c0_g2_i1.p1 TRINITY_DN4736_c0_g2~~TRINITY_DN4736_c0_g2_i1.p1  ORF type:complete len:463 (+),score=96.31 TRINITY_DN4736_c0_g2_i1:1-1389(+)
MKSQQIEYVCSSSHSQPHFQPLRRGEHGQTEKDNQNHQQEHFPTQKESDEGLQHQSGGSRVQSEPEREGLSKNKKRLREENDETFVSIHKKRIPDESPPTLASTPTKIVQSGTINHHGLLPTRSMTLSSTGMNTRSTKESVSNVHHGNPKPTDSTRLEPEKNSEGKKTLDIPKTNTTIETNALDVMSTSSRDGEDVFFFDLSRLKCSKQVLLSGLRKELRKMRESKFLRPEKHVNNNFQAKTHNFTEDHLLMLRSIYGTIQSSSLQNMFDKIVEFLSRQCDILRIQGQSKATELAWMLAKREKSEGEETFCNVVGEKDEFSEISDGDGSSVSEFRDAPGKMEDEICASSRSVVTSLLYHRYLRLIKVLSHWTLPYQQLLVQITEETVRLLVELIPLVSEESKNKRMSFTYNFGSEGFQHFLLPLEENSGEKRSQLTKHIVHLKTKIMLWNDLYGSLSSSIFF